MVEILDRLLASEDPVIRYKALKLQLGSENDQVRSARERIPESTFVQTLLSHADQTVGSRTTPMPNGKVRIGCWRCWLTWGIPLAILT